MMKFILTLMFQGVFPCLLGLGGGQYNAQARQNEAQAAGVATDLGKQATAESSQLNPFFSREMNATHLYDPNQTNELLTAADASSGGVYGGVEGELKGNAARTGNATTLSKDLSQLARDRAKSAAGVSEGVAAQDVMGAKDLNQRGAASLQGLYGTNVSGQLGAMKQANEDVSTEQATQGQNWLQQLDQIAKFGGDVAGDISGFKKAFKG